MKRQDWKGKRRAHRQLLDQTFCSVGCCHHQSTGRKGKGTEFTKVRSSESACKCRRPRFDSWVRKILWRREQLPTSVFCPGEFHGLYSPRGRKESDATERFSLSRSSGSLTREGIGYPLQCSWTLLVAQLEKEMATHFSVPAWRIPGTEEPGRRPSMALHRVRHD